MELMNALSSGDIVSLVVLAILLLVVLLAVRMMFKLTATLFRVGCFVIFLIVAGAAAFLYVN